MSCNCSTNNSNNMPNQQLALKVHAVFQFSRPHNVYRLLHLVLYLVGFGCHCGWKIGFNASILLSCFTHGSSNVPLFNAIGCVYMECLFLQNERKLYWPEWSLDAISCASIRATPHLIFHLEVWSALHHLQTQWCIEQGSEPQCRPFYHGVTMHFPIPSCIKLCQLFMKFTLLEHGNSRKH